MGGESRLGRAGPARSGFVCCSRKEDARAGGTPGRRLRGALAAAGASAAACARQPTLKLRQAGAVLALRARGRPAQEVRVVVKGR